MAAWSADPRYTELAASRGAELMRAALLITGNRHDAEDAVQDAVIAVSAAWPRVTAYQYLRKAVVRRAIENRRPATADVDLYDRPVEDERFLALERHRRFVDLLSGLPPQQRAVLVLKFHLDCVLQPTAFRIGGRTAVAGTPELVVAGHGTTLLRISAAQRCGGTGDTANVPLAVTADSPERAQYEEPIRVTLSGRTTTLDARYPTLACSPASIAVQSPG